MALIQYDLALASTSKTSGLGLDHVVLEHIPEKNQKYRNSSSYWQDYAHQVCYWSLKHVFVIACLAWILQHVTPGIDVRRWMRTLASCRLTSATSSQSVHLSAALKCRIRTWCCDQSPSVVWHCRARKQHQTSKQSNFSPVAAEAVKMGEGTPWNFFETVCAIWYIHFKQNHSNVHCWHTGTAMGLFHKIKFSCCPHWCHIQNMSVST